MSSASSDEEDAKSSTGVLSFSLKRFDVGPEMKKAIERILLCIEVRDMNITLLVAAAVVLAKSGSKIDARFSTLCDDAISDIVDTDSNISSSKFYDKITIKKNILRYCRFILSQ